MATHLTAPTRRHPVRWAALGVAAAVLLPSVVVFASRLGKDATAVRSVLLGRAGPKFNLETVDGQRVASTDLAGRIYVVNFWASWCPPCRKEHPNLDAFYQRFGKRGIELLGVVFSDTAKNARKYRADVGGDWPLLMDPGDRTAFDFGVRAPPETFVVDESGRIRVKLTGAVGPGQLEAEMVRLGLG